MLNVSNLSSNYANIRAVQRVSLTVPQGSLVALIGANGSGKSTTMKTIAGHHRPVGGQIEFDGNNITSWHAYQNVRNGLAFIPERPDSVLLPLTIDENLALSSYADRGELREMRARCNDLFPFLADRRSQVAGTLSGGEQQMVALARALMTNPRMLLVDSPVIGLAPTMVDRVYDAILQLRGDGLTFLLIEQNAAMALVLADYVYLLHRGQIAMEGLASELRSSEAVIDTYLG
jgi:branched-chain amino acid transport system ATP-binding protein